MTAHIECSGVGKFDCDFEEQVYVMSLDGFSDSKGDAESTTGWWTPIDLAIECEGHPDDDSTVNEAAGAEHTCDGSCTDDWAISQHFGSPWLVIGGNDQGHVQTVAFETEEIRQVYLDTLEEQFDRWYDELGELD